MGRARQQKDSSYEERMTKAIQAYNDGREPSLRATGEIYDIRWQTLRDRINGAQTRQKAHSDQQVVTSEEEKAIVRWIARVDALGWPPNIDYVRKMALGFIRSHGVINPTLGDHWITRFLKRHPELASRYATRLDRQRSYASNPEILRDFFTKALKLAKVIVTYSILPENLYNMDEKGFMMGQSTRVKVICRKQDKHTRKTQDGNREMVTVVETVSAAGRLLPPMVIYKGQAHLEGWHAFTKRDGTHFARSEKGWTSREIGLDYLTKIFEPNTKVIAGHYTRLFIIDGHDSHVTWEFLSYCLENDIVPVCLPAHSTHILQPLDVGLFGPLSRNYSTVLDEWMEAGNDGIRKGTFYPLLQEARAMTYSTTNIRSSFEATGIEPLNPRRAIPVLDAESRKTRETRSIHVGFSIPATPTHGRSILMHGRRTMNLLPDGTPLSKLKRGMVEKLVTAAAAAIADNVILVTENTRLRKRAMTAEEKQKSKSRKHLSKARVISAEDVIRLQLAAAAKQRLLDEKRTRALKKKEAKEAKKAKKPAKRGRPRRNPVTVKDKVPKEVESEVESSDSSEGSEMACQVSDLAMPVPSRTRAGRAHTGSGGGSSKSFK